MIKTEAEKGGLPRRQADKMVFAPTQISYFFVDPTICGKDRCLKKVFLVVTVLDIISVVLILWSSDISKSRKVLNGMNNLSTVHTVLQHDMSRYNERSVDHFSDFRW